MISLNGRQAKAIQVSVSGMFIGMLAATFVLFAAVAGFQSLPCWALFPITGLIAYPVWLALSESALFRRRALLKGAAQADSFYLRTFWQGHFATILLVLVALCFAVTLLAIGALLTPIHWGIMLGNVLVLPFAYILIRHRFASEIQPQFLGLVVRGWPLRWFSIILFAIAFFLVDFALIGAPDTRLADWRGITEQAFTEHSAGVACPAAGWLVGGFAVIDQFGWHWAQIVIPQLPDLSLKIGAWLLFLLRFGLLALVFTLFQCGVMSLVERPSRPVEFFVGGGTVAKTFLITILVLAIPFFYAALKLRDVDIDAFHTLPDSLGALIDPCHLDTTARENIRAQLDAHLVAELDMIERQGHAELDGQVDELFERLGAGVDSYLDWYFTVVGEYERLGALILGDFQKVMSEKLQEHVFETTDFQNRLDLLSQQTLETAKTRLGNVSQGLEQRLAEWSGGSPCRTDSVDLAHFADLNRDKLRVLGAAGSGAAMSATVITASILSKKVAANVIAKVAAKESFQAAAAILGKAAAKKGASAGAAAVGAGAICSPGGLLAIACGVTAGVITWFAADKTFIEIDEALSRDQMRADIIGVLEEEKESMKTALKAQQQASLMQMAQALQSTLDQTFVPVRDGL